MGNQHGFKEAKKVFRRRGGLLRTTQAIQAGVHPRTLYAMRDVGEVEKLARGVYRLAELPPLAHRDLVTVALRAREGVICLLSALAYHGITTQIPHEVYVALPRGRRLSTRNHPPVRVFWFSQIAFAAGVETHTLDRTSVRIYSPEKTLADCFKYRNKIGLDTALEALRLYCERRPIRVEDLLRYAKVCRAEKVMRPYMEALL